MGKYDLTYDDGTPYVSKADVEQSNEASGRNDNVVTRSLRGSMYGAGSQLTSLADAGAEAAGLPGVSQSLRGVSAGLRDKAALPQNAPKVGSFRQLREDPSLSNAGEYLGGLVGGSLPVMGAATLGAVATGGAGLIPGMMGAAGAIAPFEMGDVVQKQQEDPDTMARPAGGRLRDAVLGGTGSAIAQSVVPGIVGRQLLGKAGAAAAKEPIRDIARRNAANIPMEGLAEGGGEVVKQFAANQSAPLDREAIMEATIGGAAAGGAFGVAGAGADIAHSRAGDVAGAVAGAAGKAGGALKGASGRAADAAKNAGGEIKTEAPKRVASMGEDLSAMFAKARESGGDAINRMKAGAPLVGDLKEFGSASLERAREMTDLSDNAAAQKVKEWGTTMMNDAGLTPERREQVAAAMANAGDRASQATMAGLKETWDKGRVLADKARKLREAFKRRDVDVSATEVNTPRIGDGDVIDVESIKKSNDFTGANRAIAAKLAPLLSRSQPDLAGDPALMEDVSDSVRQAVTEMPRDRLTADATAQLMDTLGDDTVATLDAAFREIGDPAQEEAFYLQLNELAALQKRTRKLEDLVSSALTEESQGMIRADQMGEFTRLLVSHARGERSDANAGPAKRAAAENHFREQMALHFGPKATAVSLAIEKEAGMGKADGVSDPGVELDEAGNEIEPNDGGFDEDGNRISSEQMDVVRKGRGKNNAPVMDPALFASRGESGQNYAAQYMKDMQAKYPEHDVKFEKAEGSTTHGYVVAQKAQDKDALSDADIDSMKLDTKKYPKSKDRVEVGGMILDTRRIAKALSRRMPYSAEGQTGVERLSEMFNAGMARLIERFGSFDVPPTAVAGRVGGKDITVAELKKIDRRTEDDTANDAGAKELADLHQLVAQATWTAERLAKLGLEQVNLTDGQLKALRKEVKRLESEVNFDRDRELAGRDETSPRAKAMTKLLASEPGADGKRRLEKPMEDRDPLFDVRGDLTKEGAARLLEEEGRTAISKDENVRRVEATDVEGGMTPRSNMDGSAHSAPGGKSGVDLNGATMASLKMRNSGNAIARKLGERLQKLIDVSYAMTAKDARALAGNLPRDVNVRGQMRKALALVHANMPPSEVAEIINPLARDYAHAVSQSKKNGPAPEAAEPKRGSDAPSDTVEMAAQATADLEYLNNPPANYTPERARLILEWAEENRPKLMSRSKRLAAEGSPDADAAGDAASTMRQIIKKAESVLEGDAAVAEIEGGTPNPKARAAQVAASAGDADAAYAATLNKRSAQTVSPGTTQTATTRAAVEAHVLKVLGPKVGVEWKNLTHAGEFQRMRLRDIIRISVHALDPMSVAYHESLHGFFAQLRDVGATDVMNVLDKAASSAHVLNQLKAHFANQPAVLAQLKDPEERVAYMYQMWATDPSFRVTPASKGALRRVADFIRKVLGIWSNDERALHIMGYFHSGEYAKTQPSVAAAAMAAAGRNPALDNARELVKPMTRFADAVAATGSGRMRDTEIPALIRLADLIKREHTDERGGDQGFIQAARVERTKRLNELGNTLVGYEKATLAEAHEALISDTRAPSPEARLAVRAIKGLLAQTRDYMVDAGVDVGDLGKDYFPRVWDFHHISKNQQAFKDMLEPHVRSGEFKGNVDDFVRAMATRDGVEENVVSTQPGMQFKKTRLLSFITPAEAAPFVEKELLGTLSKYVTQATRKAEWHRRLGDGKLDRLMADAKKEGASKEDIELAENYMRGVDGTLGDTMNPHLRRITGNMIVYQNIRLLPLAMFSSLVDPVGIMVRGGTVQDAWASFKRGMAEIPQSYGKAGKADRSSDAAELIGAIDSSMLTSVMGDIYTQGMVGGVAQKINTAFFKYNMMEGLNRSFRVGATEAAMKFVVRHHAGGSPHSVRWMAELGLKAGDIKVMPDGRPALTAAEGLSAEQERRVHAALNQWVDGAVLRPDAADKPLWMNDPRWALVSHLKQFVYSFQKVILARVVHEIQQGNYTPLMALAAYVPVMIAADFAKGALQGGGDQPEWKQGWDIGDYLNHGVQRSGLLGVSEFGFDIKQDMSRGGSGLGALVGPTIEQFGDVMQMLGGQREAGSIILKSMPANALYAEYARNGAVSGGTRHSE